jgi:uncharacterized protein (DUF427 family)
MNEQPSLSGPAPGFVEAPDYRVDVVSCPKRIRVTLGNEIIADSTNALLMFETNHRPVYYFPRADLRMKLMVRTDHTSF